MTTMLLLLGVGNLRPLVWCFLQWHNVCTKFCEDRTSGLKFEMGDTKRTRWSIMIFYNYLFREEINLKCTIFFFEFLERITFIAYKRTEILLATETQEWIQKDVLRQRSLLKSRQLTFWHRSFTFKF